MPQPLSLQTCWNLVFLHITTQDICKTRKEKNLPKSEAESNALLEEEVGEVGEHAGLGRKPDEETPQ